MSESLIRNFTHLVIPAQIWLRRDISLQAKALWAEFYSLHDPESGGCYASDEYLMEFMGLKRRRLYEILAELKKKNLLESVSFDGRRSVRKAILLDSENSISAQQQCGKMHNKSAENRIAKVRDPALPPIYSKEDNKDNISLQKPSTKEPKIEREVFGSHVRLTKEEHQVLIKDHSKPVIDDLIAQVNDYCLSHGKSYKDYAATIRQWLRKRKETPQGVRNFNQVDRRTRNIDGTPAINPHEGKF